MKSKKLISELKTMRYWQNGFRDSMWRVEALIRKDNREENKENFCAASRAYWESVEKLNEIFRKEIGRAIVNEL